LKEHPLSIAMLSIHSSPIGELGKKDTGGMSVYVRELARALGKYGHRVDIFTRLQDPSWHPQVHLSENVRLIHLQAGKSGYMSTLDLYPYLDDFVIQLDDFRVREGLQYDLMHSHYWLSGQAGTRLQECWKVPHMFMFHTLGVLKNIAVKDEPESELRISAEKDLVHNCQRILAATERERDHLQRYYEARPEKICVVPCGVNLDLFHPADKMSARRELGFSEDESIVLYVGRLAPIKGIERLLKAVTYIEQTEPLRLLIVGGDDQNTRELRELQRLSQDLGIQETVTFVGRVEHERLPSYYCAADVLVLASHYETFGLVALEALASGTPVVATRVGAMETILREGETGSVVANGAPQLLAAGVEKFLRKSRVGALSATAIRDSVFGFGWDRVASLIAGEYAALLQDFHGGHSCFRGKPKAMRGEWGGNSAPQGGRVRSAADGINQDIALSMDRP
jgi:D-inositol-3-phosphate glycosyltransferase